MKEIEGASSDEVRSDNEGRSDECFKEIDNEESSIGHLKAIGQKRERRCRASRNQLEAESNHYISKMSIEFYFV